MIKERQKSCIKTKIIKKLNQANVYARRYFYPSLNELPYVKNFAVMNSDGIANKILCLPVYHNLKTTDLKRIINIINENVYK